MRFVPSRQCRSPDPKIAEIAGNSPAHGLPRPSPLRSLSLSPEKGFVDTHSVPSEAATSVSARACNQCYVHVHDLCALARTEPCATFRPAQREGLVPPPQAQLIERPTPQPVLAARAS